MKEYTSINNKFNKRVFELLSLSILAFSLSGCGVHKASFDCSGSKGMGCGSMIGVHKAIKNDEFPKESDDNQFNKSKTSKAVSTSNPTGLTYKTNSEGEHIYRSQDKIIRVWFNSYFDNQSNFHDSQYVYTIIAPAQWIVAK